jgi:hypothetical protein
MREYCRENRCISNIYDKEIAKEIKNIMVSCYDEKSAVPILLEKINSLVYYQTCGGGDLIVRKKIDVTKSLESLIDSDLVESFSPYETIDDVKDLARSIKKLSSLNRKELKKYCYSFDANLGESTKEFLKGLRFADATSIAFYPKDFAMYLTASFRLKISDNRLELFDFKSELELKMKAE